MWVDTHCHLDSLEGDLDPYLERASAAGVEHLVTIGTDLETSKLALRLARTHRQVWAAVGIHPHDAESFDSAACRALEELAAHPRVVAIGEVGMDFYRNRSGHEAQERAFRAQIEIARRSGKPLVMHIRDAFPEVLRVLEEQGPPGDLVFHCFSGGVEEARRAVAIGGYVSFAGNVSYKNAHSLREAAAVVPMHRLLVETDSPYLAPVPLRGKPNEPGYVAQVGEALAAAMDLPVEEVAASTTANAKRLFGLAP